MCLTFQPSGPYGHNFITAVSILPQSSLIFYGILVKDMWAYTNISWIKKTPKTFLNHAQNATQKSPDSV